MQHNYLRLTRYDMEAVNRALDYIQLEFPDNISLGILSMEVNLPKDKLQAGLKQITAMTLHRYLLHLRINKAKELLSTTDDPLKSIAELTGFKDDSYFCKVFRRHTRLSPAAYRLQHKEQ